MLDQFCNKIIQAAYESIQDMKPEPYQLGAYALAVAGGLLLYSAHRKCYRLREHELLEEQIANIPPPPYSAQPAALTPNRYRRC